MQERETAGASLRDLVDAHAEQVGHVAVEPSAEERRRLELLWLPPEPSARGRRPRFTRAEVVAAGLAVAASDGLGGVTMRRVAGELGAGAMSLYTYVPGRDELVDLMIDAAYAELDLPTDGGTWREGLLRYADSLLRMYAAHPWLLDLNQWRLPLAPHVLDAEEAGLRVLAATPLTPEEVVGIRDLLETFVHGLARELAQERRDGDQGVSQEDYWTQQSHFWETHFDPERYPTMTRMWLAGAFEVDRSGTEQALAPLLAAVERAIAAASAGS
ncbi:TetR/AcrR family transcriptional regulator C-terminal domain-containing protein [Litorihabitans aurantiacus]|uniref:TetR family transcriptional regulator n=1 Tax=Litorihabitans aurantiacus TaxID=1930061 RepID=A0AA38CW79_9MICO|nr:TetR/AcrR family transcriptional regulator C-terminal domain-containing protein [Litorihabitans aurantiacus]GMA32757.1 TetR family transcriptional regulator [Litorihabitans aurantiacus]